MAASEEYRSWRLALWPMILASERRHADSHPCAKATHPEAYGIDGGASRTLWPRRSGRANNGGAARAGPADSMP
jgi:hypothetical protein